MLARRSNIPVSLAREDDGREVTRFSDWMDRFFEEALHDTTTFMPQLNVAETDNAFEVTVALPGMSKKEIDVSLDNNILTISGERKYEEEDGRKYRVVETRYGRFSRSLTLPNVIDPEGVKASYKNGELIVTIPKAEEKAGKKIEVS